MPIGDRRDVTCLFAGYGQGVTDHVCLASTPRIRLFMSGGFELDRGVQESEPGRTWAGGDGLETAGSVATAARLRRRVDGARGRHQR